MAIILTKKSDTASSVPLVADLTNAAGGAELAVNTADKRLFTKTSGGTVVELGTNPSALTLPNGTANAVPYLNASKVLTSGSALTFDGTNLGIGTSSPGSKLEVNGRITAKSSSDVNLAFVLNNTASGGREWQMIGSATGGLDGGGTFNLRDNTAGTNRLTVDASGNLGLGVTPSAWWAGVSALQVRGASLLSSGSTSSSTSNAYLDSTTTWRYINTAYATHYEQTTGSHKWYTAPSGTAGNAITFTQAMTLDASGNLLVGTTSAAPFQNNNSFIARAVGDITQNHVAGTVSGSGYVHFAYSGSMIGSISQNGTTAVAYNTTSDHRLKNNVRTADALRFKDIRFVDFEWVDGRHDCGVIAHELQAIYPDLVVGNKDETEVRTVELTPAVPAVLDEEGNVITPEVPAVTEEQTFDKHQQVNYIGLIPRMGTVIQQLMAKVEAMEAEIAALKAAP